MISHFLLIIATLPLSSLAWQVHQPRSVLFQRQHCRVVATTATALHLELRAPPLTTAGAGDMSDLQGKIIHYRSFHRLTDDSDVVDSKALSIEERQMAKFDTQNQNNVVPYGRKLLILRNGDAQELMRFRVHESKRYSIDNGGDCAAILYLACEEPNLVLRNRVLELSCGLGLTGLLSTLAVGMLHNNDNNKDDKAPSRSINNDNEHFDNILPTKSDIEMAKSLLPPNMQSLTLTDDQDEALQLVTEHLHHVVTPTSEAYFVARPLDWHLHPRFNPAMKPSFYGGILSNAVDFEYPSAKELARTVAHLLEPNGRFLHMCRRTSHPAAGDDDGGDKKDSLGYLKKFLHEGYLMSLDERYVTVESHVCEPQVLGEGETPSEWKMETLKRQDCVALLASHHAEYDGLNGEYLFPMENGKFDNKNMPKDDPKTLRWT